MDYDAKQFLDLLQEHKSDETKKARRNLSAIAVTIIVAAVLDIRLTDLHILGVDTSKVPLLPVLLLAFVLVAYWAAMFFLTWRYDNEIQAERTILLTAQIKQITQRFNNIEATVKAKPTYVHPDYHTLKATIAAYEAQQERTRGAARYGTIVRGLEVVVPAALGAVAAAILAHGIYRAL